MTRWLGVAVCSVVLASSAIAAAADKGTVTFVVRDDRGNDLDAKLTLDADTTPIPLGRQQTLEPGIHDVHWSLANGTSGMQKLTVIEGQQGRIFQIIANAPPVQLPTAHPPPAPPPAPPPSALPVVPPPPAETTSKRDGSPWPYILLAGGGTLAVASGIFQVVAINEDSDAQHYFWTSTREDLSPGSREAVAEAGRSSYDAAETNQAIAITTGILAVTAVSVAVTWLLVGNK